MMRTFLRFHVPLVFILRDFSPPQFKDSISLQTVFSEHFLRPCPRHDACIYRKKVGIKHQFRVQDPNMRGEMQRWAHHEACS